MTAYLAFALIGIATYLTRGSFILALGDRTLPPTADRALRNVGASVLGALAASLLTSDGLGAFLTDLPLVAATVVAVLVAWRTKKMVWALAVALPLLWILRWLS